MRLLVFLHGTVIMHPGGVGRTRAERVAQSVGRTGHGLDSFGEYVPIGDAARKVRAWRDSGAEIAYLSSHQRTEGAAIDAEVLAKHGFPPGLVLFRRAGLTYGRVVEEYLPDVLVEDDCESIGSEEIAYWQVPAAIRFRITSVVVPEFGGVDHLPDSADDLAAAAN